MQTSSFLEAAIAGGLGGVLGSFIATAALRAAGSLKAPQYSSPDSQCCARLGPASQQIVLAAPDLPRTSVYGASANLHRFSVIVSAAAVGLLVATLPTSFWAFLVGLTGMLLFISIHDIVTLRIPDWTSFGVALLGTLWALAVGRGPESLACAIVALLVLLALRSGSARWLGRAGMGLGDVKLLAALAIWLGPQLAPLGLAASAGGGLVWSFLRRRKLSDPLPFAPFISIGCWSVVVFGGGR